MAYCNLAMQCLPRESRRIKLRRQRKDYMVYLYRGETNQINKLRFNLITMSGSKGFDYKVNGHQHVGKV